MKTKFCNKCKKDKSVDDFHKNPTKKDGLQTMCKECRKEYHKEHYNKNSEKYKQNAKQNRQQIVNFVNRYKQITGCKKCTEKRFWVLEFHHRDKDEKSDDINNIIKFSGSLRLVKEEIRKCDILCSNCHKDFHYNERFK